MAASHCSQLGGHLPAFAFAVLVLGHTTHYANNKKYKLTMKQGKKILFNTWRQPDLWIKCHSSQHWQHFCSDRKSRYTSNHKPLGASFFDASNWNTNGSNHKKSIIKTHTGSKHPFKQFIFPRTYSTGITELSAIVGWCSAPSYWTE